MRRLWVSLALVVGIAPACTGADVTTTSAGSSTLASTTTITTTTTTIAAATHDPDLIVIAESAAEIGVQMGGDDPFTLNPFLSDMWQMSGWLRPALLAGAWQPGPDGEPVADLLKALPHPGLGTAVRVGNDLELAYTIKPDARWDDGTPVTAADFLATLAILQDESLPIRDDWRDDHTGVTAVGEGTTLTVTVPPPLGRYRHLFPVVVPAHAVAVATFATDWTDDLWPSAGPFRMRSFVRFAAPIAGAVTLERHPDNPAPDGYPTQIRIDFYQRDDSGKSMAVAAFLEGAADVLGPGAISVDVGDLIDGEAVALSTTTPTIWEALFIQPDPARLERNPESFLDDPTWRFSLSNALDRASLDEIEVFPFGTMGGSIGSLVEYFLPGVINPDGGWIGTSHFLPGIPEVPLVYESTAGELTIEIGTRVATMFEAAGFAVTTDFDQDSSAAFARFGSGNFELFAIRLVRLPGTRNLLDLFEGLSPGGFLPDLWQNRDRAAEFVALLAATRDEIDPAAQIELLIEAENLLVREMFLIPLVGRTGSQWAHHPARIVGPQDADSADGFLSNLAEWHRP